MADVIDFQGEKDQRQNDEPLHIVMPDGSKWYKFNLSYKFPSDGVAIPQQLHENLTAAGATFVNGTFSFDIWARDAQEAALRLEAIKVTGEVMGQVYAEIPADS